MTADNIHVILEIVLAVIVIGNNIVSRQNGVDIGTLHKRIGELEQLLKDCMSQKGV